MQMPSTTTKIDPKYILVFLVLVSIFPIYILWPSKAQEPCEKDIIPFWNGEYPEPVVVVQEKTTYNAYMDLCLQKMSGCTMTASIIHPWSKEDIQYASKPETVLYRSLVSFSSDLVDYDIGTEVLHEGKTPDGMCSFRVGTDRWQTSCTFLENVSYISGDKEAKARQFFLTSCEEGYKGWVEVNEDLFDDIRINRGLIKGYGVIAAE